MQLPSLPAAVSASLLAAEGVTMEVTNRDKRPPFCPGWYLQPGQKAPVPPLARLAIGLGTKATYCPGPKGNRDKWPGTKACSVVVKMFTQNMCLESLLRPHLGFWILEKLDFAGF